MALKFLPHHLSENPRRVEYFRNEVRLARQVSLLIGLPLVSFLADQGTVLGNAGRSEKPDALEMVARNIIEELGWASTAKDWAYGFEFEADYLWSLRQRRQGPATSGSEPRRRSRGVHLLVSAESGSLAPPTTPGLDGECG